MRTSHHICVRALALSILLGGPLLVGEGASHAGPVATEGTPVVAGPPCARFGALELQIPDVDLACTERFCPAPLRMRVHNGGRVPVQVERATVRQGPRDGHLLLEWSDEGGHIAPGGELIQELTQRGEGLWEVQVVVRDGPLHVRLTCNVHVRNSAMDAARAACKACDGVFGAQGLMGTPGCNCRTRDGGKPCWGASECEAGCLASATPRAAGAPRSPGLCATTTSRFGCKTWVNDGGGTTRVCTD